MAKTRAHVVGEGKVWNIEVARKDNGNLCYYKVWGMDEKAALAFLRKHVFTPLGVEIDLVSAQCVWGPNIRYERTLNCKIFHPERYDNNDSSYWQPE